MDPGPAHTPTNAQSRLYGATPFTNARGTEPPRDDLATAVARNLIDIGFIDAEAARSMGAGKVLRKYASTLARNVAPAPPCACPLALYNRHQHSAEEQRKSYSTALCERPLRAWARLDARLQADAVLEDTMLL